MMTPEEIENLYRQDTRKNIEEMRKKQEARERIERLKQELAAGVKEQSPATVVAQRVGSSSGRGKQAGVDHAEWIKTYLMEHWTLPVSHWDKRYSVVELRFDSLGRRTGFRVIRSSGDSLFDASVRKAAMKLDKLPSAPGEEQSWRIKFDPEEKY
jgi:TonB family protein